ncbi:MAG: hypothetical protein ACREQ5_40880, partial [Candidatus Dormibacteria bacterium]
MSIDTRLFDTVPLFEGVARDEIMASGEMSVRQFIDRDKLLERDGKRRVSFVILEGEVRIEVKGLRVASRRRPEVVGEQAF